MNFFLSFVRSFEIQSEMVYIKNKYVIISRKKTKNLQLKKHIPQRKEHTQNQVFICIQFNLEAFSSSANSKFFNHFCFSCTLISFTLYVVVGCFNGIMRLTVDVLSLLLLLLLLLLLQTDQD